jgi:hypothetical protein
MQEEEEEEEEEEVDTLHPSRCPRNHALLAVDKKLNRVCVL